MAQWGDTHTRASLRNSRVRAHMRRARIIWFCVLFFLAGGIFAGVWYGTRAPFLSIKSVDISGGSTIDLAALTQDVEGVLNGNYLFLIPKRFTLMYPHDAIISRIKRLPRIADVQVERSSPTALVIAVSEYAPYALWCSETAPGVQGDCLYISEAGFAFAEAPSLKGATFLRYMTEGRTPKMGETLASADYMRTTKEFARALMLQHEMYVYGIREMSDGSVHYVIRGGGELLVTHGANMQEVFDNLEAILASEEFKHIEPGGFVYIDLRFGNKVFVKEFPDAQTTEENTETVE